VTKIVKETISPEAEQRVQEEFEALRDEMLKKIESSANDLHLENDELQNLASILTGLEVFERRHLASARANKEKLLRCRCCQRITRLGMILMSKEPIGSDMPLSEGRTIIRREGPDLAAKERESYQNAIYSPWDRKRQQERAQGGV
jgi:hypothetical protein